jgi:hypothetical protein
MYRSRIEAGKPSSAVEIVSFSLNSGHRVGFQNHKKSEKILITFPNIKFDKFIYEERNYYLAKNLSGKEEQAFYEYLANKYTCVYRKRRTQYIKSTADKYGFIYSSKQLSDDFMSQANKAFPLIKEEIFIDSPIQIVDNIEEARNPVIPIKVDASKLKVVWGSPNIMDLGSGNTAHKSD